MNNDQKSVTRCAIYTRKSSEEGLKQSLNSLNAQRVGGSRSQKPGITYLGRLPYCAA
jgi:hypothetical protein